MNVIKDLSITLIEVEEINIENLIFYHPNDNDNDNEIMIYDMNVGWKAIQVILIYEHLVFMSPKILKKQRMKCILIDTTDTCKHEVVQSLGYIKCKTLQTTCIANEEI